MEIVVKTPKIMYGIIEGVHYLDFGNIRKDSKAVLKVEVKGVESIELLPTCGCTLISAQDNTFTVEYKNTNKTGNFQKTIKFNYVENGATNKKQIKIKGTVL